MMENKALVSELQARKVKSYILEVDFEKARQTLQDHSNIIGDFEAANLRSAIQTSVEAVALWPQSQSFSENLALHKIVNELPRFKPTLINVTEYYHVGHDDQDSLSKQYNTSHPTTLLFAGIGDARNMHATLRHIASVENKSAETPTLRYHFTVIDIKAHAVARDLVIFMLLEELAKESTKTNLEECEEVLATLFYVYGAVIMPPRAYERLRRTMIATMALLEGTSGTTPWLLIFEKQHGSIKAVLVSWLHDAEQRCPTRMIRRIATKKSFRRDAKSRYRGQYTGNEPGCRNDDIMFDKACVLTPPKSFFEDDPLNFKQILAGPDPSSAMDLAWLWQLDWSWKPNVTLVDIEWLNSGDVDAGFGFDPFLLYTQMLDCSPRNPNCLYDYAASYFTSLGEALLHLKSRIRVEIIVGEMTQVFDQIRYGLLEHRKDTKSLESLYNGVESNVRSWKYPREYDRIHMSNVPDYTAWTIVHSPLNMSIFFRLLNHLREVGYPAHWLSDILSPLLTNTLETGARPPRTVPLALEETQQMFTNPPQPMSITPFITELTTLASIWLPALNFGLLSGHAAIPPQTGIRKYGMVFGTVETRNVYNCAHALVFVDREISFHSDVPMKRWRLREILSDDERDRRKRQPLDDRTHREGLHGGGVLDAGGRDAGDVGEGELVVFDMEF
ncbi:hypothetical protein SLS56_002755 [Neofusicoccum ribis]|uniref:DUF4470 domain-containing protein n=1 Tax=Neofusicoccum ribis TaxID=45134 RepID=A0ABR3T2S5_9PEZI